MKIGLGHGDTGAQTLEEQVEQIVAEEKDGFEQAWFSQIMGGDSLTIIALAGVRTSKIEFGTAVIPTYPRHPFTMAQQVLTVQAATSGRLTLGIGPSHSMVIENMWGMSYEKPARHMREYLSVLLPLLKDRRVAFKGETYRVNGAIGTKVEKPPSIIISALAPAMLKLAGTMTDGTVLWMTGVKTIESHVVPRITAAAKEAGRPAPRVVASFPVCVTDDVAAARETCSKVSEAEVEKGIRAVASAGATDFLASPFPSGGDAAASFARTYAVLKSLVGKV
jgi:F420-dependent oxidoreductase-like protein